MVVVVVVVVVVIVVVIVDGDGDGDVAVIERRSPSQSTGVRHPPSVESVRLPRTRELRVIDGLGLGAGAKAALLGGTAARLFGIA